jgi:hypothetical protein
MLSRIRPLAAAALAVAAIAAAAGPALAKPGGTPAIPLNTEQETTGSNTGASGFFTYQVEGTMLCYSFVVNDLSANAVAAHVHLGPRHVAGAVVIPLSVPSATSFTTSGCAPAAASLLADLQANPKAYYVNVHTPTFPGGEIRGQLK